MSDLRTAAQQALEALDEATNYTSCPTWSPSMTEECKAAVAALRAALAEPVQEPVAIVEQLWSIIDDIDTYTDMAKADDKLYRSLVERRQADRWKTGITTDGYTLNIPSCSAPTPRRPLTEEEIEKAYREIWRNLPSECDHTSLGWIEQGIRYAERAHGIGD